MTILIDAALFQLRPANSADVEACARVLREIVGITEERNIALRVLDRGGVPDLGSVDFIRFPTYRAADAVADAQLLQRVGEWVGADALISTALTMSFSLPTVQLIFGEDETALMPDRSVPTDDAEDEIALAFASAVFCATDASLEALRSRFPNRLSRVMRWSEAEAGDLSHARMMARSAVDAAMHPVTGFQDVATSQRFAALRRIQMGFEGSLL